MTAATVEIGQRRRPGAATRLHGGLLAVLVVVLVARLVSVPQNPPPAIAEIAPRAVEQITEPPPEQATHIGEVDVNAPNGTAGGTGGGIGGAAGEGEPAVEGPPAREVPRISRCVGNPPRQIEDPQSPPCVPYWDPKGDNGGATSPGVTRDEIVIVAPNDYDQPTVDFFNDRFQLYGRKLVVRPINLTMGASGCDPAGQQADAENLVATYQPFASTYYFSCYGRTYYREMARHKVISAATDMNFTNAEMASSSFRPFLWQYPMAIDRMLANTGEWVCARLQGHDAASAGMRDLVDMSQERRRFALVYSQTFVDESLDASPLKAQLKSCGVQLADDIVSTDTASIVGRLKAAEATSVICLCHYAKVGQITHETSRQAYFPEWVMTPYGAHDMGRNYMWGWEIEQKHKILGLTFQPRQQPPDKNPAVWARDEGQGFRDPTEATYSTRSYRNAFYRSMLLLASGIQMAGPNLTPETFERGLHSTVFPNPDHPINAGKVGFGGGSYSMTLDAAEYFWDESAPSPNYADDPGAYCYVEGGIRHGSGRWPVWPESGNPFKPPPCDSGGQQVRSPMG